MKKLFLRLFACNKVSLPEQEPDKAPAVGGSPLLKLFDGAYCNDPHKNIMLSPWGIQQCFGMLLSGAAKADSCALFLYFPLR